MDYSQIAQVRESVESSVLETRQLVVVEQSTTPIATVSLTL